MSFPLLIPVFVALLNFVVHISSLFKSGLSAVSRGSELSISGNGLSRSQYARFAAGSGLLLGLIVSSMASLKSQGVEPSISSIFKLGFKANSALIRRSSWRSYTYTSVDLIANSLVINNLQLLASFLYIFCHNILRRQVAGDEWVRLLESNGQSSVPASSAVSMQGHSHFLSLPLEYGLPLMASSTSLCWLVSQSTFHVQLSYYSPGPDGVRLPEYDMWVQGYSVLASISALVLVTLMMVALVGNSFLRTYNDIPPGFQLMGMNSAAIALMTSHSGSATDAHLLPIGIGVLSDQETDAFGVSGRLVISTDPNLRRPVEGSRYILPGFVKDRHRDSQLRDQTSGGDHNSTRERGGQEGPMHGTELDELPR